MVRERLSVMLTALRQQVQRSQALHRQTADVLRTLAAMEERIARQHDEMAAVSTRHAEKYQRFADDARAAAQRVRARLHGRP